MGRADLTLSLHRTTDSSQIHALAVLSLGTELPYSLEFICLCRELSGSVRNLKIGKSHVKKYMGFYFHRLHLFSLASRRNVCALPASYFVACDR